MTDPTPTPTPTTDSDGIAVPGVDRNLDRFDGLTKTVTPDSSVVIIEDHSADGVTTTMKSVQDSMSLRLEYNSVLRDHTVAIEAIESDGDATTYVRFKFAEADGIRAFAEHLLETIEVAESDRDLLSRGGGR